MSSNIEWISSVQNTTQCNLLTRTRVEEHPLKPITVTDRIPTRRIFGSTPSTGRTTPVQTPTVILDISAVLDGIDPLTKFASEQLDPLSQMAAEAARAEPLLEESHGRNTRTRAGVTDGKTNLWNSRKRHILEQFTTSEKLTIVTSFLSQGEKIIVKQQSSSVDKVQSRLEQLDYFEEGSQRKFDLSQAEYCARIEQLNAELVSAWQCEQRVKALKIAIQCAKLLSDTDVIHFYPSKFVLVTDILDIFGHLIYERLRTKTDYVVPGSRTTSALPEDFTANMVPESTKETCRNWFYKIASIRELVPRIYVEMAILKSYSFLTSSEYAAALLRLTHMIRGIGNPLVATYARCYLSRVGLSVTGAGPQQRYLVENFYDFTEIYGHVFNRVILVELDKQNMNKSQYLSLYCPALDFILEVATINANDSLLSEILMKCKIHGNSLLLLHTVLVALKPILLSPRALQLVDMVGESDSNDHFPAYRVLSRLGQCVSACAPAVEHQRQILNLAWRYMASLSEPDQYISCVAVWIEYAVKYFQTREINLILGDIIKRMKPNRTHDSHYTELKSVFEKIVSNSQDFDGLLTMIRVDVCKRLLTSYTSHSPSPPSYHPTLSYLQPQPSSHHLLITDPVIGGALMYLCTVLHDAVSALTVEDERRQVSDLLATVVRRVDYSGAGGGRVGVDDEGGNRMLSYYVEARGAFSNLDVVLGQLVQCVNTLSVQTRLRVAGNHTRKTAAFVRACAAYCFITIPSIESVKTRLELYLLSGHVALFNYCLGQADACFKAALTIIPELSDHGEDSKQKTVEPFLINYVRNFLSTLLVVPDSPERGVLSLTRTLLNILQKFKWDTQSTGLSSLYLNVLDILHIMSQETYPYHIDKVDSNDTLYGSDPKFLIELNKMSTVILAEILVQLKQFGSGRKQSNLALELLLRIATRCDLSNPARLNLAENLWMLALKNAPTDVKNLEAVRLQKYLTRRSAISDNPYLNNLVSKLILK